MNATASQLTQQRALPELPIFGPNLTAPTIRNKSPLTEKNNNYKGSFGPSRRRGAPCVSLLVRIFAHQNFGIISKAHGGVAIFFQGCSWTLPWATPDPAPHAALFGHSREGLQRGVLDLPSRERYWNSTSLGGPAPYLYRSCY